MKNLFQKHKKIIVTLLTVVCVLFSHAPIAQASVLSKPTNNLGLVGYWSFDDGTSTKATDFSGSGNAGTLTNFANPQTATSGWGNGKLGKGLNFDGVDDYVAVPYSSSLDPTDLTVSLWIKSTSTFTSANGPTFASLWNTSNRKGWIFWAQSGDVRFGGGASVTTVWTGGVSAINDGRWHHMLVTRSGNTAIIYMDNIVRQTTTNAGNAPSGTGPNIIDIGGWGGVDSNGWAGTVDDVRIYNRALSATEVTSLYNSGAERVNASQNSTKSSLDTGLVALWSFNGSDVSGSTAFDRSGNGYNGTLVNSPKVATGVLGQALSLNGTNNYVSTGFNQTLNDFTACAWFKLNGTIAAGGRILDKSYNNGFWMGRTTLGTANVWGGGVREASYPYGIYFALPDSEWNHICSIRSGTTHTLIGNGGQNIVSNTVSSAALDATSLIIGQTGSALYFPGLLDDVRIYNRALSNAEVTKLYNQGTLKLQAPLANTVAQNGLIGYWPFNGKDVNGTTTYDRSGSGNNGTLVNGPVPTIGKMGQALSFVQTPSSQYITTSMPTTSTTNISFGCWVYWLNTSALESFLYNGNGSVNGYGIMISNGGSFAGNNLAVLAGGSSWNVLNSSGFLPTKTWTHVFVTRDASTWILYVNGVGVASGTGNPNTPTGNLNMGGTNGYIDDVRFYNRTLTPAEVKKIYNLGK